jgi:hypothetical protein
MLIEPGVPPGFAKPARIRNSMRVIGLQARELKHRSLRKDGPGENVNVRRFNQLPAPKVVFAAPPEE